MTLFVDTADLEEIKKWVVDYGVCKGITTNQAIFLKTGDKSIPFTTYVEKLLDFKVPVSIELPDYSSIKFSSPYYVVKVPMYGDGRGLRIAKQLLKEGYKVNMTCLMNLNQFILACEIGVTYASFFYNRMIDWFKEELRSKDFVDPDSYDKLAFEYGIGTIKVARQIMNREGYGTKIICGSIRQPNDVMHCFEAGAHIITVTPKVLGQMLFHEATEKVIKEFDEAWAKWLSQLAS